MRFERERATSLMNGFTLAETLVSFAIVSLVVVLGLQIFASGVSKIKKVEERLQSSRDAESELGMSRFIPERASWRKVSLIVLAPEAVKWSARAPSLISIYDPDGKVKVLETIVIEDVEK